MTAVSDDDYAALVRQQLDALGYNSASIPDTVLREFLQDFEQMDVSADEDSAQPLSYPTALSTAEAYRASIRYPQAQPPSQQHATASPPPPLPLLSLLPPPRGAGSASCGGDAVGSSEA